MDEEVEEIAKQIEERKLAIAQQQEQLPNISDKTADIAGQYEQNKTEIAKEEWFKEATQQVTEKATKVQLSKDMLEIMSQEQKNALAQYALECEKKKLEYRQKAERKLIKAEVKADKQNREIEILKKRFGYMYPKDKNGDIIDFIPSRPHNIYKELVNRWSSAGQGFKKFVKTLFVVLFSGCAIALFCLLGMNLFKWLIKNMDKFKDIGIGN